MAIPKSEARTKAWLTKNGFSFIRSGRSFGLWDFWASNQKEVWFIQCKCNQGPRAQEMAKIGGFNNYPKGCKKVIFIWKAWQREPIIKEVPDVARPSIQG